MLTAKSKFCKIIVTLFACVAMALTALGLIKLMPASAEDPEPQVGDRRLGVFSVNGSQNYANIFRTQHGTHNGTEFDYVIQLEPEGQLTAIVLTPNEYNVDEDSGENTWLYKGGDIQESWTTATSSNTDFITVSGGGSAAFTFTTTGTGDAVVTLGVYTSEAKTDAYGTLKIYVTNKSVFESSYEYNTFTIDSMPMVGNGVSQTHGQLSDEKYGVAQGQSNNMERFRANGTKYFYDYFLYNGMTMNEAYTTTGYNLNVHVNGPGAVRDFAIYLYKDGKDTAFNKGDVITYKAGMMLPRAYDNKAVVLTGSDGKPFVVAETIMFRYNGSKFDKIQGVKEVGFKGEDDAALTEAYLMKGDSETHAATVTKAAGAPENLDLSVTYSSNNPDVVSVDANGLITAKNAGAATITATSKVDGISGSYDVYVADPNSSPTDALIANGKVYLVEGDFDFEDEDGTYTTGYTATASEEDGIDYVITVNKALYGNQPMQLRVRYGVDGGDYVNLTDATAFSGYRVADGDVEVSAEDEDIVAWTGDAYQYVLNVNGTGETTITLKVWLAASDTQYSAFGEVTAKEHKLGEVTIKVIVAEEDVSEQFAFSGARANKKCEVLIDYKDVTITKAAGDTWNNTENANNTDKAALSDWYTKILINGKTRDQWLAETGKNLNMHIRAEYLDFFQYKGITETAFDDGDIITILSGFRMIEPAGAAAWRYYHETTKQYLVLENTFMIKYNASAGANGAWEVLTEVKDIELYLNNMSAEEVMIKGNAIEVAVNDEIKLTAQPIIPDEAKSCTSWDIDWAVADETVATLVKNDDGTYTVKLLKDGSTKITLTAKAGGFKAEYTIGAKKAAELPNPGGDKEPEQPEQPKEKGCAGNGVTTTLCALAGLVLVAGTVVIVKKGRKNS